MTAAMDGGTQTDEHLRGTVPRLFERLAQIPGYVWDQTVDPFHSTYDSWHVFGTCRLSLRPKGKLAPSERSRTDSALPTFQTGTRPLVESSLGSLKSSPRESLSEALKSPEDLVEPVVARISNHILRLEREYHLCKSLLETADPDCKHVVQPLDLLRLPPQPSDRTPYAVMIVKSLGKNYLWDLVNFGPAFYRSQSLTSQLDSGAQSPGERISLLLFLDFAVGASECLELLHHGQRTVHGELRGDAFHFNKETGLVKLINFGSGARSFEHGLTSVGWTTLSKEIGVRNKLQFIAPEQTGRMPTSPDSRTDIYSLGILFWVMLTGEPAFDDEDPMMIVQSVLKRRLPPVSSKRIDIPDAISSIIQKMTMKQIDDRYHSASGLKYDLLQLQKILSDGDGEALKNFQIATKDISSHFNLPKMMVGRTKEKDRMVKIIEHMSRSSVTRSHKHGYTLGSNSSISDSRLDGFEQDDHSSNASSSYIPDPSGSHSGVGSSGPSLGAALNASTSPPDSSNSGTLPTLSHRESHSPRGPASAEGTTFSHSISSSEVTGKTHENQRIPRHSSQPYRRRGRCEVISVVGGAGLGKSCLVQSVQVVARRYGYVASAKFDPAKQQPFEPVLKVMSSLFHQIFSEGDVGTEFHRLIRSYVAPISSLLHVMLDIPEHLLGGSSNMPVRPGPTALSHQRYDGTTKPEPSERKPLSYSDGFLRDGFTTTKSLRFSSTFLDILRLLVHYKFICLCFDDLHFADEGSLDLISSIISAKMDIVIIVTYREDEMLGPRVRSILNSENAHLTKIKLGPLSEENITNYVAATLYRPPEYIKPLAAVLREKTAGNPFLLREVLDTCHRKNCIWYDWKSSNWTYDLDLVFRALEANNHGESLSNDFIVKRLQELSPESRSVLAWGSLLGNVFSFGLVQRLMSGEFDYEDENERATNGITADREALSSKATFNALSGLNAAVQAYVLVPEDEDDDLFRFAHDRYMQACASLVECASVTKMHFIIAQAMMKYSGLDDRDLYARSAHICKSIDIIRKRVQYRSPFRDFLLQAAQKASESGARATALHYYRSCIMLLQPNPWDEGPDSHYEETLEIFTKSAECWWYMGHMKEALDALQPALDHAKNATDRAPSWILQSRVFMQSGDTLAAYQALKQCLESLGLNLGDAVSWVQCDEQFHVLRRRIESMDRTEILRKPLNEERNMVAMGAVLVEIVSAAFWTDSLIFYQLILKIISMHLSIGAFTQVGLGYSFLAMVAIGRFNMVQFGMDLCEISHSLVTKFNDSYALTLLRILFGLMYGHLQGHMRQALPLLETALESISAIGDRNLTLVNLGIIALTKFYASDDLSEIETYCNYAAEEVPGGFAADIRGGTFLISVKQVARALQGKTYIRSPETILSDAHFDSQAYIGGVINRSSNPDTALNCYQSQAIIPLYLYGFYDTAVSVGESRLATIDELWAMRATRLLIFYLALSLIAGYRSCKPSASRSEILDKVRDHVKRIRAWEAVSDVNYGMWSKLLDAEIADISGDSDRAMQGYEDALSHAQTHEFGLEEAMIQELAAGFYLRRGVTSAARVLVNYSLTAYNRISAYGKASQLSEKFALLLNWELKSRIVADAACQTEYSNETTSEGRYQQLPVVENDDQITHDQGEESNQDRTSYWVTPGRSQDKNEGQGLGIDVIDLTSILTSSQLISSELQVNKLLPKMCEIILGGNSADFAAIIVNEDEVGWVVAASGTHEKGVKSYNPGLPLAEAEVDNQVAKHVALYSLRFREPVFLQNLFFDERFSNVSEKYLANNPLGKSVIAIPILHGENSLLGALYLEGPPNTFTDRNLTVLQLLVNQISISIANALLFNKVRKVSAANLSMVESQKRALTQAREAELKAKRAEADAIRSLKLKEEAAKAKSIFLANVSHELRTPLNGMIGNSELLKATKMSHEQEGYADSIRVCADTLLTVINDILDYSKLEAGKMQLVPIPFNLQEAIQEVVRALSCTHEEQKLTTIEELDLPNNILVMGDPVRLHQIFMNLLSNSYKFTPKGSVTVRARTEYETPEEIRITCSVSDTGIGISQAQVKRLFTPFSQADDSTARKYGGSGLGLSICKNLIQIMGGHIWMNSTLGVGTTVSFTLTLPKAPKNVVAAAGPEIIAKIPEPEPKPAIKSTQTSRPITPATAHPGLSDIPRNQLRVCVAEDNPINQKIAISFVERLGFKVDAYDDGREAVEALRAKSDQGYPYHLVLMDIMMPHLDGYGATREIRADARPAVRDVLIIAMTASAITGDREKCLEAGMDNYLAKPVRANVLKKMLEQYLQQEEQHIPNIQHHANDLAKAVLEDVSNKAEEPDGGITPTNLDTVNGS